MSRLGRAWDLGRLRPDPGRVHLPDVLLQLDAGVGAVRALGEVGPGHVHQQALGRVPLDVGAVQALLALGGCGGRRWDLVVRDLGPYFLEPRDFIFSTLGAIQ